MPFVLRHLLAARADQIPPGTPLPTELIRRPCSGCGAELVLTTASDPLLAAGLVPTCDRCLPHDHYLGVMTPDQATALRGMRRAAAERN